jgi:hypothetical protein
MGLLSPRLPTTGGPAPGRPRAPAANRQELIANILLSGAGGSVADQGARLGNIARILLGCIRCVNGAGALFAPRFLLRRLGADPVANPAALYAFRMFGVRTLIIGIQLLFGQGEVQREALRTAPIIHATDIAAAVLAGLPARGTRTAALISIVNTVLALIAQPRSDT